MRAVALAMARGRGAKALPYDAEVEWLESSGTQWINTGIFCPRCKLQCGIIPHLSTYIRFVAASARANSLADSSGRSYLLYLVQRKFYRSSSTSWGIIDGTPTLSVGTEYDVSVESTDTAYNIQCGEYNLNANYLVKPIAPIILFADVYDYTTGGVYNDGAPSKGRMTYVRIFDLSDNLLWDGIPVRVGDVGYMYDRVSKKLFANGGADPFVIGNDVGGGISENA